MFVSCHGIPCVGGLTFLVCLCTWFVQFSLNSPLSEYLTVKGGEDLVAADLALLAPYE